MHLFFTYIFYTYVEPSQKVSVLPLPPLSFSLSKCSGSTQVKEGIYNPRGKTLHQKLTIQASWSQISALWDREKFPCHLSHAICCISLWFTYYPHNILLCKRLNSVQQGTFPVSEDSCPALDEGETVSLHCFGDYLCFSSLGTVCLALFLRSDSSIHRTRVQK